MLPSPDEINVSDPCYLFTHFVPDYRALDRVRASIFFCLFSFIDGCQNGKEDSSNVTRDFLQ